MHRTKAILILLLATLPLASAEFSGAAALEYTAKAVSFGPRPPGSKAHARLQAYILGELKKLHCRVVEDDFTAGTPRGKIAMKNIIARFHGTTGRKVVVTGHYDTKWFTGMKFVGANDGGSSTGFLLELARAINGRQLKHEVILVWFDGEEAFRHWSSADGIYGSRHLAERWSREKVLPLVIALINVDMIGDRDLGILEEQYSARSLTRLIWRTAKKLGYGDHFLNRRGAVEDDHIPFLKKGVTAADLIDFDYGPLNKYWHTEQDTMDKLSAQSFEIVGKVILAVIEKLEQRK